MAFLALAEMKLKAAVRDLKDAEAMIEKSEPNSDRDHLLRVLRTTQMQAERCLSQVDYMIEVSSKAKKEP